MSLLTTRGHFIHELKEKEREREREREREKERDRMRRRRGSGNEGYKHSCISNLRYQKKIKTRKRR